MAEPWDLTVESLVQYLDRNLDWAADEHPAIDEFASELRSQVKALRAVNGTGAGKPERMTLPCPTCDQRALVRDGGDIHCRACGRILRQAEYDQRAAAAANAYQEARA